MAVALPVTLLTGFLGAGKTTLLNHIVTGAPNTRFCVVENEFGTVGVDNELVDSNAAAVFSLNEGCVCCDVRDDLVALFERLIDERLAYDHVLIETSGLANPGPVMRVIERMRGHFRLHGVVAVVDAGHARLDRNANPTWTEQLANADLIVLNKVSSSSDVQGLAAELTQLNPVASQVQVDHARIDIESVLSLNNHDIERIPARSTHAHDRDVGSVVAQVDGHLDPVKLDAWLGALVRTRSMELMRMKGILALDGHDERFVFQAVRSQLDVQPGQHWGDDERLTRIVFIGRGLNPLQLQSGLQACAATQTSPGAA